MSPALTVTTRLDETEEEYYPEFDLPEHITVAQLTAILGPEQPEGHEEAACSHFWRVNVGPNRDPLIVWDNDGVFWAVYDPGGHRHALFSHLL